MKKTYRSRKNNFNITVETLDGQEISLISSIQHDASSVGKIFTQFTELEKEMDGSIEDSFLVKAKELALVYDKEVDWFLANLDTSVITNILKDVVKELIGSEPSSKK